MKKLVKVFICIISLILSLLCFKYVKEMDILPNKYLYIFLIILICLNLIASIFMFLKGIISKIISIIIFIILILISIIGIKYSKHTIDFLNNSFQNNEETSIYNVIVLKDSKYKKIEDLNNTIMGHLITDINNDVYLKEIDKKISVEQIETDFYGIYNGLLENEMSSIVINEAYIDIIEDIYPNFSDETRIIYTFHIKKDSEVSTEKIESLEPINIYLSGSDSRSSTIVANSLSDVNIIITINPNTHKILLTNIPRDYYVQLHGTTGLKDKLTHAGIYGIDMSRNTISDLFDIKIDYSIKVGFGSVVKIVDLVGGVDIYSDITFNSYHIKGWTVYKGINHMDGTHALAYSRERYAYSDGDRHRGRNQQQVIEAVFSKITQDKNILLKYDTLLKSFSSLYITDIPKEIFTMLIKQQLSDMSSWEFLSQEVTGFDSSGQTYSMPGWQLYVMVPDVNSLEAAKSKIKEVISENPNEEVVEVSSEN